MKNRLRRERERSALLLLFALLILLPAFVPLPYLAALAVHMDAVAQHEVRR